MQQGLVLTWCRVQGANFATVLVGPDAKPFNVHEELLTLHSPFFRAALTGNFKEAEDKTVTLKEEDPKIFEFFVHWLYYNCLPDKDSDPALLELWDCEGDCEGNCEGNCEGDCEGGETKTGNLLYLHVFCDKYDVPELKRQTMDMFYSHQDNTEAHLPDPRMVEHVFSHLAEKSPLCRYLVDLHCHYAQAQAWDEFEADEWPRAFLTKVMRRYTEYALGDRSIYDPPDICDYHDHPNEEAKAACKAEYELGIR